MIEVVDGWADVPRYEVEQFADLRTGGSFGKIDRKVLLARLQRLHVGIANRGTIRNSRVG